MRATVDSAYTFSTRKRSTPDRFTLPLTTVLPSVTSTGALSPVRALIFSADVPVSTVPSSGTRSPGLTTIVSPTATCSGFTRATPSAVSTLA